jgi:hypothetical protein
MEDSKRYQKPQLDADAQSLEGLNGLATNTSEEIIEMKTYLRINEGHPQWLVLSQLFSEEDYGFFLSFDEIFNLTGISRKLVHSLIPLVNEHLESKDKILMNVRGKGYRVDSPYEMEKRKDRSKQGNKSDRHLYLVPRPPIRSKK